MKLTKMAGAFALTAAMAMTAVPAFAAADATNVEQFKDTAVTNESAATTKVYAETINASLNATIPTRVAIVIPSYQGGEITAPSSEVYKIVNKTTTNAVYLKKIESAGSGFKLSANTTTMGNDNVLTMSVSAGSFTAALDGQAKTAQTGQAPSIAPNGGELGLALTGSSWVGTPLSSSALDSAVMSITYTIGTQA